MNAELILVGFPPNTDNIGASIPESWKSWEILAVVDTWAALRSITFFDNFVFALRKRASLDHSYGFSKEGCGVPRRTSPARHRSSLSKDGS
jgi:hypothetical protein